MGKPSVIRDSFAELLAEGLERVQIMARLGLTKQAYRGHLRRVREDLGWQAR